MVKEDTFKMIYAQFFPRGADTSQYAHYVFNTFDQDNTGAITFTVSFCKARRRGRTPELLPERTDGDFPAHLADNAAEYRTEYVGGSRSSFASVCVTYACPMGCCAGPTSAYELRLRATAVFARSIASAAQKTGTRRF